MRLIMIGLLVSISASAFAANVVRLSEPVAVFEDSEVFGSVIDPTIPQVTLAELLEQPERHQQAFRLTTTVTQVCQKKGCFFITQLGEQTLRIAFKDYAFFIPSDSTGKQVTLVGELIKKPLSEEQAAHFNADMGPNETAMVAGEQYEILASGVQIFN
ncbi:DUF4920 domain-containing protein [Alteromonas facilis]|uniref:DUF4920 domain-containing protein n=1 Tax=Alteromonas facilis TaxID=2048004 RepID=UPI000C287A9C|nr:DUF4920 domain-containing protein [Alteromonas facilis]